MTTQDTQHTDNKTNGLSLQRPSWQPDIHSGSEGSLETRAEQLRGFKCYQLQHDRAFMFPFLDQSNLRLSLPSNCSVCCKLSPSIHSLEDPFGVRGRKTETRELYSVKLGSTVQYCGSIYMDQGWFLCNGLQQKENTINFTTLSCPLPLPSARPPTQTLDPSVCYKTLNNFKTQCLRHLSSENAYHNIPEAKITSLNCLFCPNPKVICLISSNQSIL